MKNFQNFYMLSITYMSLKCLKITFLYPFYWFHVGKADIHTEQCIVILGMTAFKLDRSTYFYQWLELV
jgi:hypothetical protein